MRCRKRRLPNRSRTGTSASSDLERSIAGCNKIIARSKDTKASLAIAYANRGNDYHDKGDYDKAIADYTQSIKLNPSEPATYRNRGWSSAQMPAGRICSSPRWRARGPLARSGAA